MEENAAIEGLLSERTQLLKRIRLERDQLQRMRKIADDVAERLAYDERALEEIDSVLGRNPQLRLEDADVRLRGRRLEEVALQVLAEERGPEAEIHYREWFELLVEHGHLVSGKEPVNTFLAQINRSDAIESVGRRTGRYRLSEGSA